MWLTLCLLSFCSVGMRSGDRSLHAIQHAYVCQSGPPLRLLHLCKPPKRYSHMDFQVFLHGPCTAVLLHRYKSNCHLRGGGGCRYRVGLKCQKTFVTVAKDGNLCRCRFKCLYISVHFCPLH